METEKQIKVSISKRPAWISGRRVVEISLLDRNKLRRAKASGLVRWRQNRKGGIEYDLRTIPENFLKPEYRLTA